MVTYALTHSTSFAMGIGGGNVTDWRLYDSIYTERFMLMPQNNPEGYAKSSALAAAKNLHGQLLLIHGVIDENVHAQNTLKFTYELQKAGKPFRLMLYEKSRHGVTDPRPRQAHAADDVRLHDRDAAQAAAGRHRPPTPGRIAASVGRAHTTGRRSRAPGGGAGGGGWRLDAAAGAGPGGGAPPRRRSRCVELSASFEALAARVSPSVVQVIASGPGRRSRRHDARRTGRAEALVGLGRGRRRRRLRDDQLPRGAGRPARAGGARRAARGPVDRPAARPDARCGDRRRGRGDRPRPAQGQRRHAAAAADRAIRTGCAPVSWSSRSAARSASTTR